MKLLEQIMKDKGYVYESPGGELEYKYSEFSKELSKHYMKYNRRRADISKQRIYNYLHRNVGDSLELSFLYALFSFSDYTANKFMALLKNELGQEGEQVRG